MAIPFGSLISRKGCQNCVPQESRSAPIFKGASPTFLPPLSEWQHQSVLSHNLLVWCKTFVLGIIIGKLFVLMFSAPVCSWARCPSCSRIIITWQKVDGLSRRDTDFWISVTSEVPEPDSGTVLEHSKAPSNHLGWLSFSVVAECSVFLHLMQGNMAELLNFRPFLDVTIVCTGSLPTIDMLLFCEQGQRVYLPCLNMHECEPQGKKSISQFTHDKDVRTW